MTNGELDFGQSQADKFHHKEHREHEGRTVREIIYFLRPFEATRHPAKPLASNLRVLRVFVVKYPSVSRFAGLAKFDRPTGR
jgi:hypothetical protein